MRVVITGGTGLIGRELAALLRGRGDAVRVLSRRPDAVTGLPEGTEVGGWDAADAAALAPQLEGADAVVHLAGESIGEGRWTDERKARIRESRVRSTQALVEAVESLAERPKALVQASAVGFYGTHDDEVIDERTPAGDDFLASVCRDWEAASAGVERLGVRRAIARTGVVLSERGGALPRMALPFRLFAGGPVGSGRQWLPWIHLADEVAAIALLLDRDELSGPFNLTAPEPVTNARFAKALGRALGRPSLLPTPGFAIRLALGEMSVLVLEGQRAVPSRLLEAGYEFRFASVEAALRNLLGAD